MPVTRAGGMEACISPRGNFSREVIYITLQEVFWLVSITWILIQAWDKLRHKKK